MKSKPNKSKTPKAVRSTDLVRCDHTITNVRPPQKGAWCVKCGVKVYDVESRECQGCRHAKKLANQWVCNKHLMRIAPDMKVMFNIEEGSCWVKAPNAALCEVADKARPN